MRVAVVGTGYVGLVTGVCLAEVGHDVVCVDVNAAKVAKILRGEPPIHEVGLEPLLRSHLGKRFTATGDLAARRPGLGSQPHRGGNAVRRDPHRPHLRPPGRRRDRRGSAQQARATTWWS